MRSNSLAFVCAAAAFMYSAEVEAACYGFGRTPTTAEVAALDIDARPDGQGLPSGHGNARDGAAVFAVACASCHGDKGQNASLTGGVLAGGAGTLTAVKPVKTIGSYWPYATTLFDFIRRAMPFNAPQSLSNDELYAVTAYLLSLNGIVADDAVLDAVSLPKVRMPNRDGFEAADWRQNRPAER